MAYEAKTFTSISQIAKSDWDACFAGCLEGYEYLRATEEAGIPGFSYGYISVSDSGSGRIVAAAGFFMAEYGLETTLPEGGSLRGVIAKIRKNFPRFLKLRMAAIGSPVTENAYFGFHPSVADKAPLAELILREFDAYTKTQKISLLGIKELSENDKALVGKNFKIVASMPTGFLNIDFADVDSYLAHLSYKMRKNLRQKLKKRNELRIEKRHDIDDVLAEIHAKYLDTRNRSDWKFEELPPEFFKLMLRDRANSVCIIYYVGEKLLAANFLLGNEETLLDKYFCAFGTDTREYNLYFISWIENVKYCIENNIKTYIAGQANFSQKRRLGCDFRQNFLAFRHRNPLVNSLLRMAAPLLAADLGEAHEE